MEDVCAAAGLDRAVAFTLTRHGCATGLLALDLAGRLLEADDDPDALALVLSGEKTFSAALQLIPESPVMGEATAAALVAPHGERDPLLGYACRTEGRYAEDFPPDALDPSLSRSPGTASRPTRSSTTCARAAGRLRPGDLYLMAAVGLGATFSVDLERVGEQTPALALARRFLPVGEAADVG
ncbi:hypothetical protein QQY24_27925 [Streptomyces sp. TG1A-8]|uniref:hypothetical protein n=1 Tax=Streptomyces sp. TG1A-8 TaxID=3051385 RepID=UPI00265BC14F|nr:hypothetical protein [Streptomyces sp. TG1A-8]MDO0929051.1 hypothetical protein [Streptomyces sp. TG1A-8]